MTDFELAALFIIAAITSYGAVMFWIGNPVKRAMDDWDAGDPGPHYGRDPHGGF